MQKAKNDISSRKYGRIHKYLNMNSEFFSFIDYELCSKKIFMGCSFNKIVEKQRDSFNREKLTLIRNVYEKMPYFILHDHESMYVMLHENITDQAVVKGWFHAVILGIVLRYAQDTQQVIVIYINKKFSKFKT